VTAPAAPTILQLTRSGATRIAKDYQLIELRDEFRRNHVVRLPGLIEPALLDAIVNRFEAGVFETKAHGDAALELCLTPDASVGLLHFLVNEPAVYELIEFVGETSPIRSFFGRVYRHLPGGGHYQDWHGDLEPDRRIGMSINLGRDRYDGGIFQIRPRDSERAPAAIHNAGFGDAIVFRLRDDLEHRVTALEGRAAKTAFAGWFRSSPDYVAVLRGRDPR
jgi:hypothetical protein